MIVYICDIDENNKIVKICEAADKTNVDAKNGLMFARWLGNYRPQLFNSYSMKPDMKWVYDSTSRLILTHGIINIRQNMENISTYKV